MSVRIAFRASILGLSLSMLITGCGSDSHPNETIPSSERQPNQLSRSSSALLSWEAPNSSVDGRCLYSVASFRISIGLASQTYEEHHIVDASTCTDTGRADACGSILRCSHEVTDLTPASWYFAVQAIDQSGLVSESSGELVKTIQ